MKIYFRLGKIFFEYLNKNYVVMIILDMLRFIIFVLYIIFLSNFKMY